MLKGNKVWTPNGYQAGPTNSLVGKGESIIDYTNGTGTLVTKGKVGVDNQPSSVQRNDDNVIAGNDIDWSNGMKFSDQVAPLTAKLQMYNSLEKRVNKKPELSSLSKQTMELQKNQIDRAKAPILQAMKNITDRQEKQHQIEDYTAQYKANCGKDRFDGGKSFWKSYTTAGKGKVSNFALDAGYAFPALLEAQMLNHWRRENPIMPNIYAANKYAPIALQTMAGNRMSANPVLEKLYAQDRQAAYQLANAGGYTGGQRQANRTALALGNQRNVADALMNVQEKNIGYRNAYADMAAKLGDSEANRLQQANQYGWEAYNKAHGAKTKGIETHLANLGLIGQKWLSQRIKNKQYGDILDMYQQDIDNKSAALKAIYGIGADNDSVSNTQGSNVQSNAGGSQNVNTKSRYLTYGDTNVLNKFYRNTPLGNVFSISRPWSMSDIRQRMPKGGQQFQPDTLPSKRYNSDYIKGVQNDWENTKRYADRQLQYQRGAFNAPYETYSLTSDPTGMFGGNALYSPTFAGVNFDYNPLARISLTGRK